MAGCALAAVAIAAVGAGLDLIQDVQTAQAVVQLQANPENVKTNDDRVAYLESCGWLVGEEAANQEDIRLPDVFDDSYEAYLTLQESQGFDLTQYAGKTIQRYTYAVKNFPGLQENIWANCSTRTRSSAARYTPTKGMGSCRGWPIRRSSKGGKG